MRSEEKRRYFNELAPRWDGMPAPEEAPAKVRAFAQRAAAADAQSILDVGCGTGVLLPALRQVCPGAVITELDFAEEMLRENAGKWSAPHIRWVCADGLRLPFRPAAFDAVLCFGVLPHFADLDGALREIARVLRPGGALAVGHLMGSAELNAFHSSIGGPVAGDVLPGASELGEKLNGLGLTVTDAEDGPEGYFVRARKLR